MSDEATVFKLTFNKPAQRQFFDGPDVKGLRIKMDADGVYFRPISSVRGPDTVRLVERTRGGHEVTIEGSMAQDLLDALMSEATAARPFFILSRSSQKGWVQCNFYDADEAPQKFSPHMRVWAPHEKIDRPAITSLDDEIIASLGDFSAKVHDAHRLVTEHLSERKVGRPPREVRVARAILGAFEVLANTVLPYRGIPGLEVKPLRDLRDRLDFVLSMSGGRDGADNWHDIEGETLSKGGHRMSAAVAGRVDETDPRGGVKSRTERKPKVHSADRPPVRQGAPEAGGTRARSLDSQGDTTLLQDDQQPDLPLMRPAAATASEATPRSRRNSAATREVAEPVEVPPASEEVPPASPLPVSSKAARARLQSGGTGQSEPVRARDDKAQLEPDFVQVANFEAGHAARSAPAPAKAAQGAKEKLAAGSRRRA